VGKICQLAGFEQTDGSKIVLAVDEACSNVIKHAYKGRQDKKIFLKFVMNESGIQINILDFGISAEMDSIKPRSLKDIRPGGLGVHLIRSVMDNVEYKPDSEKGNQLILNKSIPKGKR
ncbi:ATP-binding protein, partial [candidate division KSB1 bacterium]|nr:ATP-binding protein [candidate division KSB1 bacterium]